jgi:thiol:disulfide interchange protein
MIENENLGSFLKENKKLVKDYLDTRLEIFRFKLIRMFSKSAGYLIWVIISLFLFFLLMTFIGLVIGFWLTDVTGSYVKGFGYTSLIMLGLITLLALFRKALFVNPIIRIVIRRTTENNDETISGNHYIQNEKNKKHT